MTFRLKNTKMIFALLTKIKIVNNQVFIILNLAF